MLKKKTTYLKVFVLMITILFSITAYTFASSISNVTGLKADISGKEVYLNWNSVSDANGYDVYFNIPGYGYTNIGSVSSNSAKVSGFTPGYDYKSKIMAYKYVNGSKVYSSAYSNEVSVMIPTLQNDIPANVTNLKVSINNKQAYLTWDKVNNASGYDVYFNVPGQGYMSIGSVDTNSAYVSGFTPGYTYYAKILAYKNSNGKKVYANSYSNEVSVKISEEVDYSKPGKATNLTAYINKTNVAVDWNKAANATGYDVYLYTPGYGYKKLTSTTNNYYDIPVNTLQEGKTYYVKVLAYRVVNGQTIYANEYSNEASFYIQEIVTKPNKATGLTAYVNNKYVAVDWNKATNATGYDVYLYTPGYGYKKLTSTSNNYYDIPVNTLQEGKTYYVKVLAYRNENGKTTYSTEYSNEAGFMIKENTVKPGQATNLIASVNNYCVALDWKKATNATGYDVYLYTPGYGYKKLTSTNNNYYDINFNTLTSGKTYYVKVLAYRYENGKTTYADNYSNEASFYFNYSNNTNTKPGAISGLNVKVKGTVAYFTWNKVNNVDGYELRMTIPGYGTSTMYSSTNSKTVSGLTTYGSSYTTSVYAYKYVNGKKVYGNPATVKVYRNNL